MGWRIHNSIRNIVDGCAFNIYPHSQVYLELYIYVESLNKKVLFDIKLS